MTTTEATLHTRDPFRSLLALSRRGGDVARYRAGTEAAFLINNPAYVKHVLVDNHENYSKGTFINNLFKQAIADGLLTSEGEDWWRQRRLMQPAFYRERVARIGDGVTQATLAMAERWASNVRTGEPLDVAAEMGSLTLRITTRALFSVDISQEADSLGHRIAEGLGYLISPDTPEFLRGRAGVEETVSAIIEERRTDDREYADLLAMLFAARDQDTGAGAPVCPHRTELSSARRCAQRRRRRPTASRRRELSLRRRSRRTRDPWRSWRKRSARS